MPGCGGGRGVGHECRDPVDVGVRAVAAKLAVQVDLLYMRGIRASRLPNPIDGANFAGAYVLTLVNEEHRRLRGPDQFLSLRESRAASTSTQTPLGLQASH